jgi:hypothetical protein
MGIYHRLVSSMHANPHVHHLTARVSRISSPQILMHSVLASRILFNLRESEGRPQTTRHKWEELTDIQFGSGRHSTVRSKV